MVEQQTPGNTTEEVHSQIHKSMLNGENVSQASDGSRQSGALNPDYEEAGASQAQLRAIQKMAKAKKPPQRDSQKQFANNASLKSIEYDPSKSQMYLSNIGSKAHLTREQQLQRQDKLPVAFNSDRRLISDFAKFNKL